MRFPRKVPVGIGVLFTVVWIEILMSSCSRASEPVPSLAEIIERYGDREPELWGEDIPGVLRTFGPDGSRAPSFG